VLHPGGKYDNSAEIIAKVQAMKFADTPIVIEPTPNTTNVVPGKKWLMAHLGWNESNTEQNRILSKELWPLSKYCKSYTSISGIDNSWCGVGRARALKEDGYAYPENCESAYDWVGSGKQVDWKKDGIEEGDNVVIEHFSGGHHITGSNRRHKPGETVLEGLGCNQSNSIKVTTYSLTGPECDKIIYVGRPVKA
jgi:hypothetical protein